VSDTRLSMHAAGRHRPRRGDGLVQSAGICARTKGREGSLTVRSRLAAGGRWIRTIGPRHERAGFCCGRRIAGPNGGSQKGLFLMRYRWFESISLQRRVILCRPIFAAPVREKGASAGKVGRDLVGGSLPRWLHQCPMRKGPRITGSRPARPLLMSQPTRRPPPNIRGGSRMQECRTSRSVRERPVMGIPTAIVVSSW